MNDQTLDHSGLLELTSDIVSAHTSNNAVPTGDLPSLIQSVYATLQGLSQPSSEPEVELKPAVPVRKSVSDDFVICLDCGKKMKMLKRHLKTDHDLTPEEYRAKWSLPHDYPMVAPNYSDTRKNLAKKIGLGRKPKS